MPNALDTLKNTYSVFISETPYNASSEPNFIYLCSDASLSYGLTYNGTTTGILGQRTSDAIFVDPSSGAVGNINISGTRVNPATSANSPSGFESNLLSNASFYNKMKTMLQKNQMFQNAYILRIYNVDWKDVTTYSSYRDLYVHITKFDMDWNWNAMNDAGVSLTCFRRNKTQGFGAI